MAVFTHVSTDLNHNGVFIPGIPIHRHRDAENTSEGRVCVAPDIAKCLTAIPNGGCRLDELNTHQRGIYLIFRIDTEKLGIPQSAIVTPEELYQRDFVRDADMTEEYWITTSFQVPPEDQFIIKLTDWDEDVQDILPFSIFKVADSKFDGDYLKAYTETFEDFVPSSIEIKNPQFIHENVNEGEEISFYVEDNMELGLLKEYINNHFQVEIKSEEEDNELVFVMKEKTSLRPLFLYHNHLKETW